MVPLTFDVRSALKVSQVAVRNAIRYILQGRSSQDIHRRSYTMQWAERRPPLRGIRTLGHLDSEKIFANHYPLYPVPHGTYV